MAAIQHRSAFLGRRRIHLLSWLPYSPFNARRPNNKNDIVPSITRDHHVSPAPSLLLLQHRVKSTLPFQPIKFSHNGYAKLASEPLRILFCGSDDFSAASLRALHALQQSDPSLVESIDVLVRPGKPVGRGRKHIHVGPLHRLAVELGLPVHQRETFTGWELPLCGHVRCHRTGEKTCFPHPTRPGLAKRPPQRFNLVLAVSFGLFVPPRILHALKYGGLNVHPSLLPDLRGPAPLQWTIIARRPVTGVTLQTLHPAEYDRGVILAQTPPPGILVPEDVTLGTLHETLAAEGAKLLVDGLRRQVHVPPYETCGGWWPPLTPASSASSSSSSSAADTDANTDANNPETTTIQLRDAPKMTNKDAHVDWRCRTWGADKTLYPSGQLTADDIVRRARAMGLGSRNKSGGGGDSNNNTTTSSKSPSSKPGGLWSHALVSRPSLSSFTERRQKDASLVSLSTPSTSTSTSTSTSSTFSPPSPFAAQDKRVILTDMETIPCPTALRKTVRMIVQVRRSMLMISAEEEEEDAYDEYDDGDHHQIDHERHSGGESGSSTSPSGKETLRGAFETWKRMGRNMDKIGSIAWSMPEDPHSNTRHQDVRLPVLVDETDSSVTIPIGVPYWMVNGRAITVIGEEHPLDALKINFAKVAGSDNKPAAVALAQFLELPLTQKQVQEDVYAVDVMSRRLDDELQIMKQFHEITGI